MTSYAKCFVCFQDILDRSVNTASSTKAAEIDDKISKVLSRILTFPHLGLNGGQGQNKRCEIQKVRYCLSCSRRLWGIRDMLSILEDLKKKLLSKRNDLELELWKSWNKSWENLEKNERCLEDPGDQLRDGIISELQQENPENICSFSWVSTRQIGIKLRKSEYLENLSTPNNWPVQMSRSQYQTITISREDSETDNDITDPLAIDDLMASVVEADVDVYTHCGITRNDSTQEEENLSNVDTGTERLQDSEDSRSGNHRISPEEVFLSDENMIKEEFFVGGDTDLNSESQREGDTSFDLLPGGMFSANIPTHISLAPALQSRPEDLTTANLKKFPGAHEMIKRAFKLHEVSTRSSKLMSSISATTLKQYNWPLNLWWNYCEENSINLNSPTISEVIQFIQGLFDSGSSYSTLNTARAAISLICQSRLGDNPELSSYFRGIHKLRPGKEHIALPWNPYTFLAHLANLYPLEKLSLKSLTSRLVGLLYLATNRKILTFSTLDVRDIKIQKDGIKISTPDLSPPRKLKPVLFLKFFKERKDYCVASTLVEYIKRTEQYRKAGKSNLFLCLSNNHESASPATMYRWIKNAMNDSGLPVQVLSNNGRNSIESFRKTADWKLNRKPDPFTAFFHYRDY